MSKFKLLPHQDKAVNQAKGKLDQYGVVIIAAECRTGKTSIALTLASKYSGKVLVLSKKKALEGIQGDSDALGVKVFAINYESAHKVASGAETVILDEVHCLSGFPKPSRAAKLVKEICKKATRVILLSATPAIESSGQWYHIFWATRRGPFQHYSTFYKWFKEFGVPKKIKIAGGMEVNDYSEVKSIVSEKVKDFAVMATQNSAGFKVKPTVLEHYIEAPEIVKMGNRLKKDGIIEIGGHSVVAETPAAALQKMAMVCGGTLINDEGESLEVYSAMDKLEFLERKMKKDRQYAIFTSYIAERSLIIEHFEPLGWKCGDDMEAFKAGELDLFVGSLKRYSEGFDLSWLVNGAMIIYSLTFSGTTFHQILNRMIKYDRVDPAYVHILMIKDSVEEKIFKAVNNKQTFNAEFIKKNAK